MPCRAAANRPRARGGQTSTWVDDRPGGDMDKHDHGHDHACCAPGRAPGGEEVPAPESANDAATDGLVRLGGSFLMGTEDADGFPQDREGPIREIDLPPFWIDPVAVTNAR